MRLSSNFTLAEMVFSNTAARKGIDNTPDDGAVEELQRLCATVLQPLRDELGASVIVTSGFRSRALNTAVGGSLSSDHMDGRAADIQATGFSPLQIARVIETKGFPYKQLIHEFGGWVHVSIAPPEVDAKRELLTAIRLEGRTRYVSGVMSVDGATEILRA